MKSQFAACARKAAYATSGDAEAAAKGRFGVYLCPVCTRYHLTSSKPSRPGQRFPEDEKPTFDGSLLGRAKLVRSKPEQAPRTEVATCIGKARPDGRVRLKVSGRELWSEPVQPASLRLELRATAKVNVRIENGRTTVLGLS